MQHSRQPPVTSNQPRRPKAALQPAGLWLPPTTFVFSAKFLAASHRLFNPGWPGGWAESRLRAELPALQAMPTQTDRLPEFPTFADARVADSKRWEAAADALRIQPLRSAILLIGGDKTGDDRWYEKYVSVADRLFQRHLLELKNEGGV
jgi:hypothetical protein